MIGYKDAERVGINRKNFYTYKKELSPVKVPSSANQHSEA